MKPHILFILIFLPILSLNTYSKELTNEVTNNVILPQTEFVVEVTQTGELFKRDREISPPFQSTKGNIKQAPSIKTFEKLEREIKQERDNRSTAISSISYGLNDFLEFAIIAINEAIFDNNFLTFSVKYNRLKRASLVLYKRFFDMYSVVPNSKREHDLFNLEVTKTFKNLIWNANFEFFEDFRGLAENKTFSDETYRNIKFFSELKYIADEYSKTILSLLAQQDYNRLAQNNSPILYTTINNILTELSYLYGIEEVNFFKIGINLGITPIKLSFSNDFIYDLYGGVFSKLSLPVYSSKYIISISAGLYPSYLEKINFDLQAKLLAKLNEKMQLDMSVGKFFSRRDVTFIGKGITILSELLSSESSIQTGIIFKIFQYGNILSGGIKYSHFFKKTVESPVVSLEFYTNITTNFSEISGDVTLDIINLEFLNFSLKYLLRYTIERLPYIPIHEVNLSAQVKFDNFSVTTELDGGAFIRSGWEDRFDIPPYILLDLGIEYNITENISASISAENLLNNISFQRIRYIFKHPFSIHGSVKIKL